MTEMQVDHLFKAPLNLQEQCVLGLLYGCGMRISEVCNLRISDIDSANKRIKVVQGKGGKDRFTLLPPTLLNHLRQYFVAAGKPKEFMFTSTQTKRALHVRSMQVIVNRAMEKAGFESGRFTAHTLRHSKLETTMIYLHLQHHTQMGIVSPLERLSDGASTH